MSKSNQRITATLGIVFSLTVSVAAQEQSSPQPAPTPPLSAESRAQPAQADSDSTSGRTAYYASVPGKKKAQYVGPKTLVELPPTPLLDEEGRQRLDPNGKPMFNPPLRQQRDKHGNPLFDANGKPVMQTPQDMGYDEKGKKIHVKKVKPARMISVSIERGILTVDGMPGKAGLNYDIKDLKFIYLYAPWIGLTIVSHAPFPGAIEQKNAFDDKTLTVMVDTHNLQLYSDKRLLGKRPEPAFVAVDRDFKLPAQFPVIGYGETLKPPYAWPGSRENAALKGLIAPPPLPASLRPATLLQPCPPGQMRVPGRAPLPGENVPPQPCVLIQKALPSPVATTLVSAKAAAPAASGVSAPIPVTPPASADATPPPAPNPPNR
jgi:hypothetical protein